MEYIRKKYEELDEWIKWLTLGVYNVEIDCRGLTEKELKGTSSTASALGEKLKAGADRRASFNVRLVNIDRHVKDCTGLFNGCNNIITADVSKLFSVTNIPYMFKNCSELTEIVINDILSLSTNSSIYYGCSNLKIMKCKGSAQEIKNSIISKAGSTSFPTGQISTWYGPKERDAIITVRGDLDAEGYIKGAKVFGAVWNDLADKIIVPKETKLEYGKCYIYDGKNYRLPNKYAEKGYIGIHSDTYGFAMGEVKDTNQLNSAVAGYVLAFTKNIYPSGTPMTYTKNGFLTKANLYVRLFHSERIVGTFWKKEENALWNGIEVNNRNWIKIK